MHEVAVVSWVKIYNRIKYASEYTVLSQKLIVRPAN